MSLSRTVTALALLVALLCSWCDARELLQNRCSSSPGKRPRECNRSVYRDTEWRRDEIECNVRGAELSCELEDDWDENGDVECELDIPGQRDIEFRCRVNSNCNLKCPNNVLNSRIPRRYRSKTKKILSAWKPT
ncbi:hypothetical protein M9434_001011 [Picochlorum sp. BPE23]|nr:hypothetical protein M9434_001011 [Picochlorum sp. BPE23]